MAAKKYYAVKKGKVSGIFDSWEDCKESVEGFPGAEYKGFPDRSAAETYLGLSTGAASGITPETVRGTIPETTSEVPPKKNSSRRLLAYVDGSYDDSLPKYAFGCVFLPEGEPVRLAFGNGDNPQSLQHRNVTGEMLGAMYATRTAMMNGYAEVEICYDYAGIEKWVTGSWRSKTELTGKYALSMREWSKSIRIIFTKVPAHSNIKYNELADKTAKRGLTEGQGVPKVCRLEELEIYEEV